jgi:hypothetical protein
MRRFPKYTDSDIDKDMRLTRSDYITILRHYRRGSRPMRSASMASISTKTAKSRAHRILAEKLCSCIKPKTAKTAKNAPTMMTRARKRRESIEKSRRIAYCTQSIFNNRRLRRHGFRCKTARGDKLQPRFTSDITKSARVLLGLPR